MFCCCFFFTVELNRSVVTFNAPACCEGQCVRMLSMCTTLEHWISDLCLIMIYHIQRSVYMDKELTGALGNVLVWYVARLQLVSSMG